MTDKRGSDWWSYQKGHYIQQKVHNPPSGQQPNNSRFAVWHFSKMYKLYKFENPDRWGTDGRGRRGDPTIYDFMCNVQPFPRTNSQKDQYILDKLPSGYELKSLIIVTYDPFIHKSEIEGYNAPDANSPMYQDGIFINSSDSNIKVGSDGYDASINHAHPDWLLYDGVFWQSLHSDLTNGGDEELQVKKGRLGHVIMSIIDDQHQEKHASLTNRRKLDVTEL